MNTQERSTVAVNYKTIQNRDAILAQIPQKQSKYEKLVEDLHQMYQQNPQGAILLESAKSPAQSLYNRFKGSKFALRCSKGKDGWILWLEPREVIQRTVPLGPPPQQVAPQPAQQQFAEQARYVQKRRGRPARPIDTALGHSA